MTVNVGDIIKINISNDHINTAKSLALKKLKYTIDTWQERSFSVMKKFIDIFTGDIAKECVKEFLVENGVGDLIEDYDDWRVKSGSVSYTHLTLPTTERV